jgi:hypothetical protein
MVRVVFGNIIVDHIALNAALAVLQHRHSPWLCLIALRCLGMLVDAVLGELGTRLVRFLFLGKRRIE